MAVKKSGVLNGAFGFLAKEQNLVYMMVTPHFYPET